MTHDFAAPASGHGSAVGGATLSGAMDISAQSTRPSAADGRPDAVDVQPLSADERAELVRVAAQANDSAVQETMRHERGGSCPRDHFADESRIGESERRRSHWVSEDHGLIGHCSYSRRSLR